MQTKSQKPDDAAPRLFIAIQLPQDIRDALKKFTEQHARLSETIRWVPHDNLHLTLKFFGNVPAKRITKIKQCLDKVAASHSAFSLAVSGIGVFPGIRNPRIIWAGTHDGNDQISAIEKTLSHSLCDIGFPKEKRSFTAHITIARVKSSISSVPKQLTDMIEQYSQRTFGKYTVSDIALIKSDLRGPRPVYTTLHASSLNAQNNEVSLD